MVATTRKRSLPQKLARAATDPTLILDDPLEAVVAWSHDPDLNATARMASGMRMTAVEAQWKFFECAQTFHAERGFEGVVPRADEILTLWGDTLQKLHDRDFDALGQRLDCRPVSVPSCR